MNKESFLYVVIFTFIVAFIFVFVISLADGATAERVARNQVLVTAQAFLNAVDRSEEDGEKALKAYEEFFGESSGDGDPDRVTRAQVGGEGILIKQFSGQGLWGTITGVIAVSEDLDRVVGMDIISHAETPGLGGRIEEAWFKEQFRGEKISEAGIGVRKGEGGFDSDTENSLVDGITGASLTSASVETIINNEIEIIRKEAEL